MAVSIRPTKTIKDCQAIEWLQAEIWGSVTDVTPAHMLLTIAKEGGVVLLALDGDSPVGFAYAFPALTDDGQIKLASHQAGVLPAYQNSGLGYNLKLAQREAALDRYLKLITWTFDPLQGRNARLNLRKLGAVCKTYIPNLYGDMSDELNQGLPSDRFRVDWWIASERVQQRIAGQFVEPDLPPDCLILNPAGVSKNNLVRPAETFELPAGEFCLVEIPTDLTILKTEAPNMALNWRLQTREIFEAAFNTGYTAIDLVCREGRNYYLLQKNWRQH